MRTGGPDGKGGSMLCGFSDPCPIHTKSPDNRFVAANLARKFHHYYEREAPRFNYESKYLGVSFDDLPQENRELMIAVCSLVLADLVL